VKRLFLSNHFDPLLADTVDIGQFETLSFKVARNSFLARADWALIPRAVF